MPAFIPLAMSLAQYAPELIRWLTGSDKAEAVAAKAVEVAQAVTGQSTPAEALEALKASTGMQEQFREAVLAQETEFARLAVANATDVNKTMQAEAVAEHWPTYSWRPSIGFAVAFDLVMSALVVTIAYVGVMFFGVKPEVLSYLPAMLGAMAALVAIACPILGIASYWRGRMQADPSVPTINRG